MQPYVTLEGDIVQANVRAWEAFTGSPVWPVLKNDAYGWGIAPLVRALDDRVEGYFVTDADEFDALRALTARPIALLADTPLERLPHVMRAGGIPVVSTLDALGAASIVARASGAPARVRIGLRAAAGWSGIDATEVPEFARACADLPLRIEVWTHISSPSRARVQRHALDAAARAFREAGAAVVSTDCESTSSATALGEYGCVRLGAGLFGARLGTPVEGVSCAFTVSAPVIERYRPGTVRYAGYGDVEAPPDASLVVGRCGYGDGLPPGLAGKGGILSIGMQFVTADAAREREGAIVLLDAADDLDAFATVAGRGVHEVIVAFGRGRAARA